ncbi:hypothetical protein V757_11115 [Pelistega indica]|uniref:Uncharacterized protein n=1 Tax=Pelistega indica TaxID=1414851 RepID=V8FV83_9BURK|nr:MULTISPECIES: hypothetical protein [Pelistega]ETD67613.1 hypothetical protein V757_11115 [Pelistega indica]
MTTGVSQQFYERVTKNPVNIVKRLLSQGKKAYYSIGGVNIVEYPDGTRFRVEIVNGDIVEKEPYGKREKS